jgi:predicted metal-dependent phosphoesterase TrpH
MSENDPLLRLEFHCHTRYSKDSLTGLKALLSTCRKRKIDRLVITDHNTIQGALIAREMDPERVIIGEEIKTTRGELLAAYVRETIPAGLSPLETIHLLRQQEAFISVSHPFDVLRSGHWELEDLLEIIPYVDAIETFNARCMRATFNLTAIEFARQNNILGTVGSDAHSLIELGKATQLLPDFHDAASLKKALACSQPDVELSAPWVHFSSRYAVWRKNLESTFTSS